MKISRIPLISFALLAFVVPEALLFAQDLHPSRRPSPLGTARTTIGDTYMRVVYGRPYRRGREIFGSEDSGALVPFGKVWRTGANEATEISLTGDVKIGDRVLPAGTYSLFTIPGASSWTVHFNSALGLSGTGRFDAASGNFVPVDLAASDVLVYTAPIGQLSEEVDQFTIAFEDADGGADLCLRWVETEVRVPIRLP